MTYGAQPIRGYSRAILHIDGDAFFASCEQARNPELAGKPVIIGKERGIVSSLSYEAKALGITRAMRLFEVRKICPQAIILPSDYETYSLLSHRFYSIVRRYTPEVEEYGIDECFADITGLRRIHRGSYADIAEKIRADLARELGFTFSVGLGSTKVIAKLASKWKKPNGFTAIQNRDIPKYLQESSVEKVWGIGPQTTAHLAKLSIHTAGQLAAKPESFITNHFYKPVYEIWQELNGISVLDLATEAKTSYQTISKTKTFTPPSTDKTFVFSQLSKNVENACIKARRYFLETDRVTIFLRTQDFYDSAIEVRLTRPTAFPNEIIESVEAAFNELFVQNTPYRSTGIFLGKLQVKTDLQPDLFGVAVKADSLTRIYASIDDLQRQFGKHTVYLATSHSANTFATHLGERGDIANRKTNLFKGETMRKHLAIPMLDMKLT